MHFSFIRVFIVVIFDGDEACCHLFAEGEIFLEEIALMGVVTPFSVHDFMKLSHSDALLFLRLSHMKTKLQSLCVE